MLMKMKKLIERQKCKKKIKKKENNNQHTKYAKTTKNAKYENNQ